ncbi:MAG: hypothetical protein WBB23_07060 [Desulforhopalus sp.]
MTYGSVIDSCGSNYNFCINSLDNKELLGQLINRDFHLTDLYFESRYYDFSGFRHFVFYGIEDLMLVNVRVPLQDLVTDFCGVSTVIPTVNGWKSSATTF